MNKLSLLFFTFILLAFSLRAGAQNKYHSDPNLMPQMKPDYGQVASNAVTGIKLVNNYADNISILLSNDNVHWDTTSITGKSVQDFNLNKKYILIYTTATNLCHKLLTSGNSYSIYWDGIAKRWDIK